MNVLIACEFSGIVRGAFDAAGHYSVSCDILPSESPGAHRKQDIFEVIDERPWDLIIAHPPCTFMAVSGNRWYADSPKRLAAIRWTLKLWEAMLVNSKYCALENPVGVLSTYWRPPDQYIQPWEYGHAESKKTGLWLSRLPLLRATHTRPEVIEERVWRMAPSPDRSKDRSRFYPGIATAMADQWAFYKG